MNERFMELCIELALDGMEKKGHGPFGAAIVKGNELVAVGTNQVTSTWDPTAHAEISAIRDACSRLKTFSLEGLEIYTTCEPCPMCLGAIFWARLSAIYFGATRLDAASANFDDRYFYEEIEKPPQKRHIPMKEIMRESCIQIFDAWKASGNKISY